MIEWTDSAKAELKRYLAHVHERLEQSGADPGEVEDDLLRHINEEAAAAGLAVVTREDVVRLGDRMGLPAGESPVDVRAATADAGLPSRRRRSGFGLGTAFFAGFILPMIALLLELFTGMCGSIFFDPIPTLWHILLVAAVPVAAIAACLALWRGHSSQPKLLGWLNGIAVGVALYYTIVFIPLTPFAFIGIIYFGLGLIPLAPLFSLCASLALRRKLRALLPQNVKPALWRCIVLVLVVLVVIDAPKTITMAVTQRAARGTAAQRARAVRILRRVGSKDVLLRACYGVNKPVTDMAGFLFRAFTRPVPAAQIQDVYYRVTGTPYNAVPPPELRGLRRGVLVSGDEWDFGQAGDAVAARVRGLQLQQSRLDGRIDAEAGTAYTEWTMLFHNSAARQHEARALVALPPDSVVSRVTLWIDGEEREAAYAGRSKVKEAYKRVVQRRRDPVLVTTSGRDRVLMQCFPVPPDGGTMKIKIGITSSLSLESMESGLLALPHFEEQNFGVAAEARHAAWFEADSRITAAGAVPELKEESVAAGKYALRGMLSDTELSEGRTLRVGRPAGAVAAWTAAERGPINHVVRQEIVDAGTGKPSRLAIVIDGSRRMEPYAKLVAEQVGRLAEIMPCDVYLASDTVMDLTPTPRGRMEPGPLEAAVRAVRYRGGCDNVAALSEAWDAVAGTPGSAILWLHATQPIEFDDVEALVQRFERRPGHPVLLDYQFGVGPNTIARKLGDLESFQWVPRLLGPAEDLPRLAAQWKGTLPLLSYKRWVAPVAAEPPPGRETDLHLARLWAHEEILRLGRSRAESAHDDALKLAMSYLLVTPVSGAVVLETEQQYKQAGLEPVDPHLAPNVVPEPATWALLLVGAVAMGLKIMRSHRRRGGAHA